MIWLCEFYTSEKRGYLLNLMMYLLKLGKPYADKITCVCSIITGIGTG